MNCDPTHLLPLLQSDYPGTLDRNGKAFLKRRGKYTIQGKVLSILISDWPFKLVSEKSLTSLIVCRLCVCSDHYCSCLLVCMSGFSFMHCPVLIRSSSSPNVNAIKLSNYTQNVNQCENELFLIVRCCTSFVGRTL